MLSPKLILVFILFLLVIMNLSWKRCVKLVLFVLFCEGAMRKWIFPEASDLIYFGKDIVILIAYAKFYSSNSIKLHGINLIKDSALKFFIICSTAIVLLQVFNLNSGSPIVGLIGARNYILYIPLMFMCSQLFDTQEELARYLRYYLLATIPICALAIYQNQMPATHWINKFVTTSGGPSQGYIGTSVRVTGTFSYIAGYAAYSMTCAALVLPLLIVHHPLKWKLTFFVIIASVVTGIMLTGSRGPMIGLGMFVIGYFVFNKAFRTLGLYKRLLIPLSVVGILLVFWFGPLLQEYMERFTATRDISQRMGSILRSPLDYLQFSGMIGYGAGSTFQAIPRLRALFSLPEGTYIPIFYESEPERIMLELGPIGFFCWYALRVIILVSLWRTHVRLNMPLLKELALTAFLLHLVSLPGQVVFQVTVCVYYWFTASFIFLLPTLEAKEQLRAMQERDEILPPPESDIGKSPQRNPQEWQESFSHTH